MSFVIIYNIFITIIYFLFVFNLKKRFSIGKENKISIKNRFGFYGNIEKMSDTIAIHSVSLGEAKSIVPFVKELLNQNKNILLTNTTRTGFDYLEGVFGTHDNIRHVFTPFDTIWSVLSFYFHFKPKTYIVFESDVWPNMIFVLKFFQTRLMYLNAKISDKSFKRWMCLYRIAKGFFGFFDTVYTSSEDDLIKFKLLNKNTRYTGNLKYTSVLDDSKKVKKIDFKNNLRKFCFVSMHKQEYSIICDAIEKLKNDFCVLIIRHLHSKNHLIDELNKRNISFELSSKSNINDCKHNVFIVDEFGVAMSYIDACDVSVVCGSFVDNIGGHNVLEPISINKFTVSGHYVHNYTNLINNLERSNGILVVKNEDLGQILFDIKIDSENYNEIKNNGYSYFKNNLIDVKKFILDLNL